MNAPAYLNGMRVPAGLGYATVVADMDFETYSEAGYVWDESQNKWVQPEGNSPQKKGLKAVGAAVYTEHPSCEVISFCYDLKMGHGRKHWLPGMPPPFDLFEYLRNGGIIEAFNIGFERWVWKNICRAKYGWPELPEAQVRCAMAKARAHSLPGKLEEVGKILNLRNKKDSDGTRLLTLFSMPRTPTKKDPRKRVTTAQEPAEAQKLYAYNAIDIVAEAEASMLCPDLTGEELEFWQADQRINHRGVQIDRASIENCIALVRQMLSQYNAQFQRVTGIERASQLPRLKKWLEAHNVYTDSLDEEHVTDILARKDLPPIVRQALEIRELTGSASVKKVFAMYHSCTREGRLHDLFIYHGARTGRATGEGPQPTNLPNSGPEVWQCGCQRWNPKGRLSCGWCDQIRGPAVKIHEWNAAAAEDALIILATRNIEIVQYYWLDVMHTISSCLRALFIAAEGKVLFSSDYHSIEAVVLAELAGETWRQEVFRTHGMIYEMSASKISGVPFEEFVAHKAKTGNHHPLRKKLGKLAELSSGYQGWIGAWKNFGADKIFTDEEIKKAILAWRAASPNIVEFWGGQERRDGHYRWPELYGVEGAAIQAIQNPGTRFHFRSISYFMQGDVLYCLLPSGRNIAYHRPRLSQGERGIAISYEGWNTNANNGPKGWIRMFTWGGRLTENIVQAVSRDILRYAIINLERAGYAVVLHVYDEVVAEVKACFGSIEEFERIMATMPEWCKTWPIHAAGGWTGKRYRK